MDLLPADVLDDPAFTVPRCPPAADGMGWLRGLVPRFAEGAEHAARRAALERELAALAVDTRPGTDPTVALLRAMDLDAGLATDVAAAAAMYQPQVAAGADEAAVLAADRAVDRLVAACGGRSERTAIRICILVQATAGMTALLEQRRTGRSGPPIPATGRIDPGGRPVSVDLTEAPFGRGRHRCPGEALARRLADAASGGQPPSGPATVRK